MRLSYLTALGICVVVTAACSNDPTTSEAYLSLEAEVSELEDEYAALDAQVIDSEGQIARHQTEKRVSEESTQELQAELEETNLEIEDLESEDRGLAIELRAASTDVENVRAQIDDFKESSSRFQSAVRQAIPSHQRYLCQQDWERDLSPLIRDFDSTELASDVGTAFPNGIGSEDMRRLNPDFADVDCGLWGEDTIFGGEESVLNRVCERVNIEKLKKNPSSYRGQCFRGTSAWVAQFDTNTGPKTFHATLGSRYGERVEFNLVRMSGESLYEGVRFDWWAVGNGSLTYTTSIGGSMTIPSFTVFWYQYYS